MKKKNPSAHAQRLNELRDALLDLHKVLAESERINYEKTVGKLSSPNQFLQLLIKDPWFAWLHPLSELIVSMDEMLDGEEPLTNAGFENLMAQCRQLVVPSENAHGFSGHYFNALQNDPDVVMAHAEVVKILRQR